MSSLSQHDSKVCLSDTPTPVNNLSTHDTDLREPLLADMVPPKSKLKVGDFLPVGGGYRIVDLLGAGNFGQVWEAAAPGGKLVALKILTWPLDHPATQREQKSLALIKLLNHPYLLDIHAIHSYENSLIIVTSLAEGNLKNRLCQHKEQGNKGIPQEELLLYMSETAEALDYLHNQDLQHRDIKPENLLLAQGHIAVGDLGLARFMAAQQVQASILGTPPYMPPEVWHGNVDKNSDQYSLAVTYVEMRRGKCPFAKANVHGLLPKHLEDSDELENLTDEEKAVILKAGAKDPKQRYSSCQAFVEALRQTVSSAANTTGYKKLKRIGKGTFGEVWLGEAPGGIPVAIKTIPIADPKAAQKEIDALQLIKTLSNPHLLRFHAYWLDEELNIVMDLADRSMFDRLKECKKAGMGGIPLDELLKNMEQAAQALDYLHENKVLHRDIKPQNLLLRGEFLRVADFGIARFLEGQPLFTATTSGTFPYMPPEVWHGKASKHSDQYSLAATYVELRFGERLFEADSIASAMEAHVSQQPDLGSFQQNEREVLLKALAKEPHQRFESCQAFVKALVEACQDNQPTKSPVSTLLRVPSPTGDAMLCPGTGAERQSSWQRKMQPSSRRRVLALCLIVAAAIGLAGTGILTANLVLNRNEKITGIIDKTDNGNRKPDAGKVEPRENGNRKPDAGTVEQPDNGKAKKPDAGTVEQPNAGKSKKPGVRDLKQPSEGSDGKIKAAKGKAKVETDPLKAPDVLPKNPMQDFGLKVEMIGSQAAADHSLRLTPGQSVKFRIEVKRDAYVGIWAIDHDRTITQIFPNEYEFDYFVPAGKSRIVPGQNLPPEKDYEIKAELSEGMEWVWVVASTKRWNIFEAQREGPFFVFRSKKERLQFKEAIRTIRVQPRAKGVRTHYVAEQRLLYRVLPRFSNNTVQK